MADNTQLDLGSGGDLISTDDIGGGVKVQRVKVQHGADGSATDVSTASPLPVGDAGGSLTVDGTVTVQDGGSTISVDDGAGSLTVDNATLSVTGGGTESGALRVTVASDSTGVLSVDDNGGSLTVDVGTALPAGTNNIGDVDVLSVVPGTSATALGKAEDAAHTTGDTGVAVLGVRRDALAVGSGTDGDYSTINVDASGRVYTSGRIIDDAGDSCMDDANNALRVNVVAGSAGGVSHTDDTAFTVASSAMVPAGGIYRTTRDNVDDGDAGALAMTQKRGLLVAPETPAGDSLVDDTNDHLKVGGPVAHDSANAGNINPLLMGARAANSPLAAVSADGDAVMLRADRLGQIGVRLYDSAGDSCTDDANDAIRVNVVAGGAAGNGTSMADDAAFTVGTTSFTPAGGTYRTTRDAVNDGDGGAFAMTERRALYATLETPAGDLAMDEVNDAVRVSLVAADSAVIVKGTGVAVSASGDIDANGETVNSSTGAYGAGTIEITGTWVGTLQFEARAVSGWHALQVFPMGTQTPPVTSTTGNGAWQYQAAGLDHIRVRASAWTSGTATILHNREAQATLSPPHVGARLLDDAGDSCMDGTNNALRVNIVAGSSAGTQFAEDAAHTTGDVGTLALAVRRDSMAVGSGTDGDYSTLNVDALGMLRCRVDNEVTVSVDSGVINASVTSVVPGTGATFLGKAEDAAHSSDDVGVMALAVRRDTAAVGSGTDGDYSTLNVNASGRLYTSTTVDAALPAGTNNIGDVDVLSVVPGTAATSLGKAEDDAHASGDVGVLALAVRRDTAAVGSGTDGDNSTLNVNASGRLYTSSTIDAALPAGTNNIGDVDILSIAAGDNNIGNVDIVTVPAPLSTTGGGTEATALRVTVASDSTGVLSVDDNGGSLTIDGTVTASSCTGAAAHDSAVSGNPVLQGIEARTTDGTAVSTGDVVRPIADTLGKQVVHVGSIPALVTSGTLNRVNTTAADVIAAAGAGVKIVVTSVLVTNAHATVSTKVSIRDGTTVKWTGYAAAVGGGFAVCGSTPLFVGTANTAVTAICGTTGADVDITVSGYTITN